MTDPSSRLAALARSAGVVLFVSLFGQAVALLAELFVARSLAPTVYGELALAYTIVLSLGSVALLGVNEGITRTFSITETEKGRYQVVRAGFAISLVSGLGSAVFLFITRGMIGEIMGTQALSRYLIFFLPYIVLLPLSKVTYGTIRAQKRTVAAVLSKYVFGRLIPILMLIPLVELGRETTGAVAYWVGVPTFTLAFGLFFLNRTLGVARLFKRLPDRETVEKLWSFSWPLAAGTAVFIFLGNLDIMMIGYLMPSDSVGYYRAVQPLKQVPMFALGSFTFLFLPLATEYYAERDKVGLNRLFTASTKWVLLLTIPLVFVFALFPENVVSVLLGDQYLPGASALRILIIGLFLRAVSGLNGDMVKAIDRPRIELYAGIAGLVANFVFNLLLIPMLGINGAAAATVIGYMVYNGIELAWIHSLTGGIPISKSVLKLIAGMIFFGIAVKTIAPEVMGLPALVTTGVLFVLAEPVVLVATRSIEPADIEILELIEDRTGVSLTAIKRLANR